MPHALVTGASGQDGSYLTEHLLGRGYAVSAIVHRTAPADDRIRTIPGDLGDPAALRRAVLESGCDELYHLAAPTFVPASWADPAGTLAHVAGATAALLRAAGDADREVRVFVASSSEVFGDAGESPQHEESPMRPRSPYGVAKLAALGLVRTLRAHDGLHASAGITFNHESPRRPERFLPRKVTRGVAQIKLGLCAELELGALDAVRDWCHAKDIVRAAHLMLRQDEPGDYVLASGVGRTVGDLVEVAFACVGLESEPYVRINPAFIRAPEATAPVGDASRASQRLGWRAEIAFEDMIEEMVRADLLALGASGAGRRP